MIEMNLDQWDYTYPLTEHINEDILNGSCYVWAKGGHICGTICIDQNQDEQYKNIKWQNETTKVLIIHRLAVHPKFQGLGISKDLCLFAESLANSKAISCLRLDAYSLNLISNRLYMKLGYNKADGHCYFRDLKHPFNCYEKCLL
jgi:GNAT superfamily N-acetyltransferase